LRAWECSEVPSAATTGALLLRERNRDSAPLVGRNRPRTTEMSACTLPAPPLPIATAPNSLNVGAQCSHAARPMRFQGSQPREVLRSHPPKRKTPDAAHRFPSAGTVLAIPACRTGAECPAILGTNQPEPVTGTNSSVWQMMPTIRQSLEPGNEGEHV
jgi:hypothetical protein